LAVNSDLIIIGLWVVIIGGAFAYLWWKGHLLKVGTYVAETREELKKCTWPTRDELKGSTVVVIISIVLLSVLIVVLDFVILKFVRSILPNL
jgi:preprotein translocase subunit SecE